MAIDGFSINGYCMVAIILMDIGILLMVIRGYSINGY
jgi:hypothetical protein